MNKEAFLAALAAKLSWLPQAELDERLTFYGELIDDRMEEGLSEEEAVAEIGTVDEVAARIAAETPVYARVVRQAARRSWRPWEIVLLVLGSPIWLPLAIAAFAVLFTCYAVVWALLATLWAVEASLALCGLAGVLSGVVLSLQGNIPAKLNMFGAGLLCAGLAIFLFFGCRAATRGVLRLTKAAALDLISRLRRKEDAA